jgi:hypothetical protein
LHQWQAVVRISAIADTRFTLMADGAQGMLVTGFTVSQVSTPARSTGVGNSAPKG